MASKQTKNLRMSDSVSSDSMLREEWSQNFDAIDKEFGLRGFNPQWRGAIGDGSVDDYNAFKSMFTEIGKSEATIIISKIYRIGSNLMIPSNVSLRILKGGRLKPDKGITITIKGSVFAHARQWMFDLSSGGKIAGLLLNDEIYPEWFGSNGNAIEDTRAIGASVIICDNRAFGKIKLKSRQTYKNTKMIPVDGAKYAIVGDRSVMDFTGLTDIVAVHLFASSDYAGRYRNMQQPIKGVAIIGSFTQSASLAGKTGLLIGHDTYKNTSCMNPFNISIDGFETNLLFTHNAWRITFTKFSSRWGKHVVPTNLTNFGENITFIDSASYDNGADWQIGSGAFNFFNTSFDNSNIIVNGDAKLFIDQAHLERPGSDVSSGYRIDIQSGLGLVVLDKTVIVPPSSVVSSYNSALFRVADNNTRHGLILKNLQLFSASNFNPQNTEGVATLVAGKGRVRVEDLSMWDNSYNYVISRYLNVLYNGDAELGTTDGWKTRASTSPGKSIGTFSVDNSIYKHGANSLKLTCTHLQQTALSQEFRVAPGQQVLGCLWHKAEITGVGLANVQINFYSRDGKKISTNSYSEFKTTHDWTIKRSNFWAIAPLGSDYAAIEFYSIGDSGTTQFWIDDVIINVI